MGATHATGGPGKRAPRRPAKREIAARAEAAAESDAASEAASDATSEAAGELVLSEAEVRRVVRLLADALAPDDGRAAKCARLLDGLSAMLGADAWFWLRSRVSPAGGPPISLDFLHGGMIDDRRLAVYAERTLHVRGEPPEHAAMRKLLAEGKPFTIERRRAVPDPVWRDADNARYVREFGLDEHLYSWVPLRETGGGTLLSGCVLFRAAGKPAFAARACRLVHLVMSEAPPLHTMGLDVTLADRLADELAPLTNRMRQLLALLLEGLTVPAAARRMYLSEHTVKDYCKAIYRHFGVRSRPALMRRLMSGMSPPPPPPPPR